MTTATADMTEGAPAVRAILDAGAAAVEPLYITIEDDPAQEALAAAVVVPDGYSLETIDLEALRAPYRTRPARKHGTVQVRTVGALLAYHAKHAADSAEIWINGRIVVDVLNAHGSTDNAHGAEWEDHRAVLELRHSTEWKRWTEKSGKLIIQSEFAEFLEGAAVDVTEPDMATMLEVAKSLEATTKADFESAIRTQSGQRTFKYKETVAAKAGQRGELEIPERIMLQLRIFEGGSHQPVPARFRYRITADGLYLGIVIDRMDEILEQALVFVAADLEAGIDRGIVLVGSPA